MCIIFWMHCGIVSICHRVRIENGKLNKWWQKTKKEKQEDDTNTITPSYTNTLYENYKKRLLLCIVLSIQLPWKFVILFLWWLCRCCRRRRHSCCQFGTLCLFVLCMHACIYVLMPCVRICLLIENCIRLCTIVYRWQKHFAEIPALSHAVHRTPHAAPRTHETPIFNFGCRLSFNPACDRDQFVQHQITQYRTFNVILFLAPMQELAKSVLSLSTRMLATVNHGHWRMDKEKWESKSTMNQRMLQWIVSQPVKQATSAAARIHRFHLLQ